MPSLTLLLNFSIMVALSGGVIMDIYNKCPFPIWPGIQGNPLVAAGGFKLDAGKSRNVEVPNGWTAARIWARTGCNGNFECETGFCGETYKSGGGQYECKRAGGCFTDVNAICPPELAVKVGGRTVGCKSACEALNTDQYCCRGAHNRPETCRSSDWPKNYPKMFKDACPTAYSYAYDDQTSTFTCRGRNGGSPDYRVQFC